MGGHGSANPVPWHELTATLSMMVLGQALHAQILESGCVSSRPLRRNIQHYKERGGARTLRHHPARQWQPKHGANSLNKRA